MRLIGIVTADSDELQSGHFERFAKSIQCQPMDLVVVLRDVPAEVGRHLDQVTNVLNVVHIGRAGVSDARNAGLQSLSTLGPAQDAIVCFPDDDCVYPEGFVEAVMGAMKGNDLLLGGYSPQGSVDTSSTQRLSSRIAFQHANSAGLFCSWQVVATVGGFDRYLGVGSPRVQAGEDLDFILAALDAGFEGEHLPNLRVVHPLPNRPMPERSGVHISIARRYWRRLPWAAVVLARSVILSALGASSTPRARLPERLRVHEPVRLTHL